jgi:hypothetical protein
MIRAKADSEAKARLEAERAQRLAEEAAAAEAMKLELEEKALKETLARKQRSLPAEPSSSDPSSVNIMVHLLETAPLCNKVCVCTILEQLFAPSWNNCLPQRPVRMLLILLMVVQKHHT